MSDLTEIQRLDNEIRLLRMQVDLITDARDMACTVVEKTVAHVAQLVDLVRPLASRSPALAHMFTESDEARAKLLAMVVDLRVIGKRP